MPNIAIYEGGKAARMNGVSRITTDDGNDGKIEWVPQSERQTGTLYVSENGTYRAEDEGLHSWSKVTVRLAGAPLGLEVPTLPDPITGAEIPTGELGELEPVPPAGLEPIDEEVISSDEAEKILEEAGLDPSDLESDDALEAIADALGTDPEDVKIVDTGKKDDVKEAEPKVEDNGQQATGTDPNTGEPATITPSGKEGAITPDELRILVEPSKTSYEDGETIDYSGIQCALYKDGQFIRNARFDELSFPMSVAEYDGELPTEYTNGEGLNVTHCGTYGAVDPFFYGPSRPVHIDITPVIAFFNGIYLSVPVALGGENNGDGDYYFTTYQGVTYVKGHGKTGPYYYHVRESDGVEGWAMASSGSSINAPSFRPYPSGDAYSFNVAESTVDPRTVGDAMWEVGQHQTVPVQWNGGSTLESSFSILVTKSSLD